MSQEQMKQDYIENYAYVSCELHPYHFENDKIVKLKNAFAEKWIIEKSQPEFGDKYNWICFDCQSEREKQQFQIEKWENNNV